MDIVIIDERGDSVSKTELNGILNERLTITIGNDGGLVVAGDKIIDWNKGMHYYGPSICNPPFVVDCVSRA